MGTSKSFGASRQPRLARLLGPIVALATIVSMILAPAPVARAATSLTVTPITWNVIGLDSNNVSVGPNQFPIGARVCNTSTASETLTNVTASFVWDPADANPYINLRPGTLGTLSVASLLPTAPGNCTDFYFEVEVTRTPAAYDTTRKYYIDVSANSGAVTGRTPTPRALYVERLISQSRNSVSDVKLNGVSVSAGGTMSLMVGNTYNIQLVGSTATNGYEQIESFLTLQNTIFRINSVATTYLANAGTDPDALTKPYADGCNWENNPSSLNYRSCLATGKYGGDITVTYNVTVIAGAGTTQSLNSLIYDFSGSSYHYNADYGVSARFAQIVSPATIAKSFSPNTVAANTNSTLTYTIKNNSSSSLSSINFADTTGTPGWPTDLNVAATPVYSGSCGSPSATLTVGSPGASFENISVAAGGTCTISIAVTAAIDGTYPNTTQNLFIGSLDTGSKASATLSVSSLPSVSGYSCGASSIPLATWEFTGSSLTPIYGAGGVTAAASAHGAASFTFPNEGSPAPPSWQGTGWNTVGGSVVPNPPSPLTYYEFDVTTSNYVGISISFNYNAPPGGWNDGANNYFYIYSDTSGSGNPSFASGSSYALNKSTAWQAGTPGAVTAPAATTGAGTTRFFISAGGAKSSSSALAIDHVIISGCTRPIPPTLAKAFSPASIGTDTTDATVNTSVHYSTLTFTIANSQSTALTGVTFNDTLPAGLVVANPPTVSALSCTTGSLEGTVTATAGSNTISLTGGSLSASATGCTFSVRVQGKVAGVHANTTNAIKADYAGANTGGANVGYGSASLTVMDPPVVAKAFGANSILKNGTTTLTFSLYNPNSTPLTGVQFSNSLGVATPDTLPSGLVVGTPANVSAVTCNVGGSLTGQTITTGANTIALTNGTLSAGATCYFTVDVKSDGSSTGIKTNSVQVSATETGTGNTSTASILVKDPTPAIKLLKQVGTSVSGPSWTSFLQVSTGTPVYYRFKVENIGDVALDPVAVSDPTVDLTGCVWKDGDNTILTAPFPLPVADANDNQIATCILGPVTAATGSHPNTASASGTYQAVNVTSTSTATYYTGQLALDFGDLPDTSGATGSGDYQTLLANNGPRHLLTSNLYLGACLDSETDGQQQQTTTHADGDNSHTGTTTIGTCNLSNPLLGDEDGVVRTMSERWTLGTTVHLNATVVGSGELACWIDWNGDGNLGDDSNKFIKVGPVSTSVKVVDVPIPNDGSYALGRALFARCRLFPTGGVPGGILTQDDYVGYAPGGEVEDYYWTFNATAVTLRDLQATTMSTGVRLMELLRSWLQR